MYNYDEVIERKGTHCIKWDYLEEFFGSEDILPMWVADMDFLSPSPVIDAVKGRAAHGVYGYTRTPDSLYESLIEWMGNRHGWNIEKDWILLSPGVVPSINFAVMALTNPDDRIIIQPPVYPPFYNAVINNGRCLVKNPLKIKEGCYAMDFDNLEKELSRNAKMVIFSNPHNPVGRVWSRDELMKFGELCLKYNAIIISDEIHCDIIYGNSKHIPIASLSKELAQNTITCTAPSKTFNIAGLSTSSVIIPNQLLCNKFSNFISRLEINSGNIFGLTACEAAYRYGGEWLDGLISYLGGNIDFILRYLENKIPRIKASRPEGTYLMWLDCRELNLKHEELKEFMIKEAKVGLNDGTEYGVEGEGYMRLNFACPRSVLEEGLRRIENAVKGLLK